MGASNSRFEDAQLLLAPPRHLKMGSHRILDPSIHSCESCHDAFGLFGQKHYCRRCGHVVCDQCTVMRQYKRKNANRFRVCKNCNLISIFDRVPKPVWHLILEFAGSVSIHNTLQVARRLQLAVPLPYKAGQSWDDFFTSSTFLAKGANGSVFKTTLRSDPSRPVAVKMIQKQSIYSQRKWHHLQREIQALEVCKHRHVIEYSGTFQTNDAVYLVLQFAHGGDLFDWLMTKRGPSEAEVVPIAKQLMSVLYHMHYNCNAVHRDIKPENIMLEKRVRGTETPTIRVADFGFARVFGGSGQGAGNSGNKKSAAQQLTPASGGNNNKNLEVSVAATPCGTLGFAAPEILVAYSAHKQNVRQDELEKQALEKSGRSPNAAAASRKSQPETPVEYLKKMDIFAAGVTFCILLTGCEPFPCHSSKAHLEAVNRGVSFQGKHWHHVSHHAKELIAKMLHHDASQRPTSRECMQSPWLGGGGVPIAHRHLKPDEEEEAARSYQEQVKSLRKNDGTVFVTDKNGVVQRVKPEEMTDDGIEGSDSPKDQPIMMPKNDDEDEHSSRSLPLAVEA